MPPERSLAELSDHSGVQSRTLRSWIAQDLIAGPLSKGPAARYPADSLHRIRAVRAMKEILGMSLSAIRQELLVIAPDRLAEYAERGERLQPEPIGAMSAPAPPDPDGAFNYFSRLRRESSSGVRETREASPAVPAAGFEALERTLSASALNPAPDRKTTSESWTTLHITPDVELSIRGQLDQEQQRRVERCADLLRDILIRGDR